MPLTGGEVLQVCVRSLVAHRLQALGGGDSAGLLDRDHDCRLLAGFEHVNPDRSVLETSERMPYEVTNALVIETEVE